MGMHTTSLALAAICDQINSFGEVLIKVKNTGPIPGGM